MSEYLISFKNGHSMKFNAPDGKQFILELTQGYNDNPNAKRYLFRSDSILLDVSDITACHPVGMEA